MHQVMNVKLYSQTIQQVKECKYLGIMMNSTNTDKAHMEYIGKKIKKFAQFIKFKLSKNRATPYLAATVIR